MNTPLGPIPDRLARDMTMAERWDWLRARISRRSLLRGALGAAGAVALGPVYWKRPAWSSAPPEGIHLAFGSDPRTDMTVSWLTAENVGNPRVELLGEPIGAETRSVDGTATLHHHVRLVGLSPGATYTYQILHEGAESRVSSFRTAPNDAAPFRFTAFGDQGIGGGAVGTTTRVAAWNPDLHFHVGDLCYANPVGGVDSSLNRTVGAPLLEIPTNQATWDTWFRMIAPVASGVPWMTTVGNHEMETGYGPRGYDGYLARFTLAASDPIPVTYAFRYSNVLFVALDGNDASYEITANRGYSEGAQDAWLESVLSTARAGTDVDFIVVGFHNCSYCSNVVHASDGGVRDRWEALFDEHQVDLVINGHNHNYERTHPLTGGAITREVGNGGTIEPATDGTTYVTAGGGGQAAYQASLHPASYVTSAEGLRIPELATWSATRYLDLSFLVVDVTPPPEDGGDTTMAVKALALDGSEIENFTLKRSRP